MRALLRAVVLAAAVTSLVVGPAGAEPAPLFAPAANYPTGSSFGPGPGAVTTIAGDVDGDGDADVVITDFLGSGPLLLRNLGAGAFGPASRVASVSGVGSLAAGDLDGDGDLDLVGRSGWEVVVLLGAGNGSFSLAARYPTLENAQQAVATGDLDGDGDLDIVTATPTGILSLLGNGDGTFATGPTSLALGVFSDLAVAQLDGDGVADLLVADATPLVQSTRALLGNGNGSFRAAGSGPVGYGPEAVMGGDLDGDGDDDAVSVDSFSIFGSFRQFTITVLLSDGLGGFGAPVTVATGNGPVSGALADLDLDGDLDAAVSSVGDASVTIYTNDGSGHLAEAGRLPVTSFPQTPAAADLDGDGQADLAVPGPGQLSVLLNRS